jgi:hypothetical protein
VTGSNAETSSCSTLQLRVDVSEEMCRKASLLRLTSHLKTYNIVYKESVNYLVPDLSLR